LRRTLSTLRKAVGESCLETEHERVVLQPDCVWVDVLVFRRALAQIRAHGHTPSQVCPACLPLLEQAAVLFRDGFMAGFSLRDSPSFDDWQFFQAETLRQELGGVLEKLSFGLASQQDFKAAASHARRWLALDTLCEQAHRQLMLIFAWDGQRNAALRQYRESVRILEQELGVPPLDETTKLYQAVLENRTPPTPQLVLPAHVPGQPTSTPELVGTAPVASAASPDLAAASSFPHHLRGADYPLVGRDAELKTMLQAFTAAGKQGFFFALEGEAGIGKTRLAEEFIRQAAAPEAGLLIARCYEGEAGLAYAPFLDGLSTALARPEAAQRLQALSPGILSLAAQLIPAMADLFPGLPAPPPPESPGAQARFFAALRVVIQALISPRAPASTAELSPVGILFLDDLQWADQASLDVLDYLTRRLDGVFLLAAWRSDLVPSDHRLCQLLARARRDGRSASLSLRRLRLQDVVEMASASPVPLPDEQVQRLFQDTEGNPFFVAAYLEAYVNRLQQSAEPVGAMPLGVRSLLLARLSSISAISAQLLSAAAVLGRSFDFSIVREVSGRSELETISALEELLLRGIVWEHGLAPPAGMHASQAQPVLDVQYDFTHDKLRDLVYEQTSLARRHLLHQRAAEAFGGRARLQRESAALAAFHFRLAGKLSQAAHWFQQAGEYGREVYANQDAIAHFHSALACGHPEPEALHEAIGDLHMLSGQYPAALSSYESAAALCAPQRLPWVEHKLGLVHAQRGDYELAECHFKAALEELEAFSEAEDAVQAERAMIYADWSHTVHRRGDASQALELALQAINLAQSCQDHRAQAQAFNNLGILERANEQYDLAIQHLQRSLEIAQQLGDPGLRAAALNNLARVYAESGQFDQAIQLTGQALELSLQRGDRHRAAALHNNLADLYHAAGLEEAAMEHLRNAVVIFADLSAEIGAEFGVKPASTVDHEPAEAALGLLPEIWKLSEW
jgi:predicted ATPase/DNA-binding SARP family transcriptional activator